jgi:hypothetical protein
MFCLSQSDFGGQNGSSLLGSQLFFMDAAHFVLLPFLGYPYSLATGFIKRWSGRKHFSVLGASML